MNRSGWAGIAVSVFVTVLVAATAGCKHSQPSQGDANGPGAKDPAKSPPTIAVEGNALTDGVWRTLEDGLDLGVFISPTRSDIGDSRIRILRIDPAKFELRLMNASADPHGKARTAKQWCQDNHLIAAINASMFQKDHPTISVAMMRTAKHVNNPKLAKDNRAMLVFEPIDANAPRARIADLEFDKLADVERDYGTLVQSIRMVSAHGKNVWSEKPQKWSAAVIGADKQGRILFIHVRSPYRMHELADILLNLPIDLKNAMYVEGGPEAQLYVNAGGVELEAVGSYETKFQENDLNKRAWPIPNVVGVARRAN
jgi:hypothetical protein